MDECEVFISVLYDKILPASFLEGRRCYNFHPGILPQYRGAGAFSWAILNGEKETGITLHEIDGDIDHGPIINISRFPVLPYDTASKLYEVACELNNRPHWVGIPLQGMLDIVRERDGES